jgi:hypothetical protein
MMKRALFTAALLLAAAPAAWADNKPPTRIDPRLMTLAGTDCAHDGIPEPDQSEQSFGDASVVPAVAMEVYDTLTAALVEAGKDKERVSTTALNLAEGQPVCFQVALQPEAWRSSMARDDANNILREHPVGDALLTREQALAFPFFAEFYVRRAGTSIAVGVSSVRYREPIWRNFQSPANNMIATLVFSRPGKTETQTVSIPLGGPTSRRDEDAVYTYMVPSFPEVGELEEISALQAAHDDQLARVGDNAARAAERRSLRQTQRVEMQRLVQRLRGGGAPSPRAAPQSLWFTSPFTTQDVVRPGETTVSLPAPVTVTIELHELKDGNPLAAAAGDVLTAIRGGVQNEVSPTARATAAAAERTADIAAITAYGTALTNFVTAHTAYCSATTEAERRSRAPLLFSTQSLLNQYAQTGVGEPSPYPLVDVFNANDRSPCPQ